MEVVGVLRDISPFRAGEPPEAEVYWPFEQHTRWAAYIVIRTGVDPGPIGLLAAARLTDRFPDVQVSPSWTLPELMRARLVSPRFALILIGAFAGMAIVISGIGVFGVVNYLVTRRSREIGIRMALGAEARSVVSTVMRRGWLWRPSGPWSEWLVPLGSGDSSPRCWRGYPPWTRPP